ncbi:hypothetical protein FBU30_004620 [Linnemannia zychae]|nr:hypothetical protein FBU30_004620 [Linnemannia zychae]
MVSTEVIAPQRLNSVEQYRAFLDKYDTFFLDCDGVIWKGGALIDGIKDVIEFLREHGKRLVFVTNNSTLSRKGLVKKFEKLGISVDEENIFCSSYATALYLKDVLKFPKEKRVFVVGEPGLIDELNKAGIETMTSDVESKMAPADFLSMKPDPLVGAVVFGFDFGFNYYKLAKAFTYLNNQEQDVHFILSNDDTTFPLFNTVFPEAGSLVQPLITALNRQPVIMGKPHKPMLDCLFASCHTDLARTCMVGDRLDTDMMFGINGNIATLLVLTGVATEQEAMDPKQSVKPMYIIDGFADLFKANDN